MDKTLNYNLNKPALDDALNVEDLNKNADIVDTTLKAVAAAAAAAQTSANSAQSTANSAQNTANARMPISANTRFTGPIYAEQVNRTGDPLRPTWIQNAAGTDVGTMGIVYRRK